MNAHTLETVTKSMQAAQLLVSDLTESNKGADAVLHLLLLPMIVDAVKLRDQLTALQSAMAQSLPTVQQPALFPNIKPCDSF